MIIHTMDQGSEDWVKVKTGKFSATRIKKLFMSESTAGYQDIIYKVAYERLTGKPTEEDFKNKWMDYGTETEPISRKNYELTNFVKIKQVGFIELDDWVGISPDGLIGENVLWETKCQKYNTHMKQLRTGNIPIEYYRQVQAQLYVTERKYCIYYAYHPEIKPIEKEIYRDEAIIKQIKHKINNAKNQVLEIIKEVA